MRRLCVFKSCSGDYSYYTVVYDHHEMHLQNIMITNILRIISDLNKKMQDISVRDHVELSQK